MTLIEPMTVAFQDKHLEENLYSLMKHNYDPIGGVFFYEWGCIQNLHWKRHEAIFGEARIALITDVLLCPNTSSLRAKGRYEPENINQLVGTAMETQRVNNKIYMPFHSCGYVGNVQEHDLNMWWDNWMDNCYDTVRSALIAATWDDLIAMKPITQGKDKGQRKYAEGRFISSYFAANKIKNYMKERAS